VGWCGDIFLLYIFLPFRMIPDYTSTLASGGFDAHVLVHDYIFGSSFHIPRISYHVFMFTVITLCNACYSFEPYRHSCLFCFV
jgi:hypothetical protein